MPLLVLQMEFHGVTNPIFTIVMPITSAQLSLLLERGNGGTGTLSLMVPYIKEPNDSNLYNTGRNETCSAYTQMLPARWTRYRPSLIATLTKVKRPTPRQKGRPYTRVNASLCRFCGVPETQQHINVAYTHPPLVETYC